MNNKAQAALEYLMTYGWALIIIATIFGVLVFVVGTPIQEVKFSSSNPTKILLKSSTSDSTTATVLLQNVTGGQIEITDIEETGSGFTVDTCTIKVGGVETTTINAGETILLECDHTGNPTGPVTITYNNFAGLEQTAAITGSSSSTSSGEEPPDPVCDDTVCDGVCSSASCFGTDPDCDVGGGATNPCCGNDSKQGTEVCDGADLGGEGCVSRGFDGGTLFCESDCLAFDTAACFGCGTVCDGVCSSASCFGTDPDCDVGGGATGVCCGNSRIEGAEACDRGNVESNMTCLEDCSGATITGCTTITRTGTYTVGDNISTSGRNCITMNAINTTLNCVGKNLTSDNGYTGILVNGYNATIQNCNLDGWGRGIDVDSGNATIQSSSIYMNSNSNEGIHSEGDNDLTITNCYIEVEASDEAIGIYLDETGDATVTGCNIYSNDDYSGSIGIYTDYSDRTTISGGSIKNFDEYGIKASNDNGIMIENVSLENNGDYGIYIFAKGTIKNNTVIDSDIGIYAKATWGSLYMEGDNVTGSRDYGIYLAGNNVRFGYETSCNNIGPDVYCEPGGTYVTNPSGETYIGEFGSDGSCPWLPDESC